LDHGDFGGQEEDEIGNKKTARDEEQGVAAID